MRLAVITVAFALLLAASADARERPMVGNVAPGAAELARIVASDWQGQRAKAQRRRGAAKAKHASPFLEMNPQPNWCEWGNEPYLDEWGIPQEDEYMVCGGYTPRYMTRTRE